MLSGLPKIFGKEFLIGYFLPVVGFLLALSTLLNEFGPKALVTQISTENRVVDVSLAALLALMLSIVLSTINREIIRLLEGYGRFNPFRLLGRCQHGRYRRLRYKAAKAKRQRRWYTSRKRRLPTELIRRVIDTNQRLALYFPHEETFLLPTALGNAIRAFETYSFAVYGIDAIGGWTRLQAVIPESFRGMIETAKARVDFWINVWLLSLVLLLLIFLQMVLFVGPQLSHLVSDPDSPTDWLQMIGLSVACVGVSLLAYRRATRTAIQWGEGIKAAFDVFLPELVEKLGYDKAKVAANPRAFWHKVNVQANYRQPNDLSAYR